MKASGGAESEMPAALVSVRCPRCQGGLVDTSYRDREYTCVMCGESWPDSSQREAGVIDPALIIEDKRKMGRPSNQARILDIMSDGQPRTTTQIAEAVTGSNRQAIERQLWKLQAVGALCMAGGGRGASGAVLWWGGRRALCVVVDES